MSSNTGAVGNVSLLVPETYAESAVTDAIEQKLAASLPVIAELHPSSTSLERRAVLGTVAERSRHAFVAVWGDPFGCETTRSKGSNEPAPLATRYEARAIAVV